jgi:hypothetical protein
VTDHPKAASANPKDFYDNGFLQELESSGFVKESYAGKDRRHNDGEVKVIEASLAAPSPL